MGQVNQIKDIRKGGETTMTGSLMFKTKCKERTLSIQYGKNVAKPKAVTCSVHLYCLCFTGGDRKQKRPHAR